MERYAPKLVGFVERKEPKPPYPRCGGIRVAVAVALDRVL